MTTPRVSILTPSFNREALITETLDSLLAQTCPDWENIIVDDGSTDGTLDIARAYAARDSRFRVYKRSRRPKGACTCRNEGVDMAQGAYLMFLDTDDLLEPFCIAQRIAAMDARPELDFAIFPSLMFEKSPHDLGLLWNVDKPEDDLTRQFRQDAICQGTGVLWRKDAFLRIGKWEEALAIWQDIDLFFRAFIQGYRYAKFFELAPDLHNRVNPTSLSRSDFFALHKTESRIDVIRRAVSLLKLNGKEAWLPEARFMLAEVASGLARRGARNRAAEMIAWGRTEGVLTPTEARKLSTLTLLFSMRLYRLPGMKRILARINEGFVAESTLGRLPAK